MTDVYKFVGAGVMILNSESVIGWAGEISSFVIDDLVNNHRLEKRSKRRGYIPVDSILVCAYAGLYGIGYTVHYPSKEMTSTNYHEVCYFIRKQVLL